MKLPISVCVPLSKKRAEFFHDYTLPSIYANNPAEVLIDDRKAPAQVKRNRLFSKTTQPYVFFCDDDLILSGFCLARLLNAMERGGTECAYAYCHNLAFTMPGVGQHWNGSMLVTQRKWSVDTLWQKGGVHPMSLWRRSTFPRFDEKLLHADTWDAELTLMKLGYHGVLVNEPLFIQFYLDEGLSNSRRIDKVAWHLKVRRKHGIA